MILYPLHQFPRAYWVSPTSVRQSGSRIVQAGGNVGIESTNSSSKEQQKVSQNINAGDNCTIVQAGKDSILSIPKSPPDIRLVRLEIEESREHGGLQQKVNIILKNNGDVTAFLLKGSLVSTKGETIRNCNHIGMQYSLSVADWNYDIDITNPGAVFSGRHAIAPNEVINFNVLIGRAQGGYEITVYQTALKFEFDEGKELVTDRFHLRISGPTIMQAGYQHRGPSPQEWGECQADNIRRLDRIGYDWREYISDDSRQYVEAVAPGIFNRSA